jgi:hypothetical protein
MSQVDDPKGLAEPGTGPTFASPAETPCKTGSASIWPGLPDQAEHDRRMQALIRAEFKTLNLSSCFR